MNRETRRIREEIRAGRCRGQAFRKLILEELGLDPDEAGGEDWEGSGDEAGGDDRRGSGDEAAYDELDGFVNRVLNIGKMPASTVELAAEMVEFYKTPARVVVELAERVGFGPGDVFVDLGAGLGQVVMLVHLLTGVRALGVEIEPAYCAYARACAAELGLTEVSFVAADARDADLSAGTVFFLFTPFKGEVFSQVMERLRAASLGRRVWVVGYGPCSEEIARLDWLKREGEGGAGGDRGSGGEYRLQIWRAEHGLT